MDGEGANGGAGNVERRKPRHGLVAAACVGFVAAMGAAAYASVPLYTMFCSLTGFGGATRVGTAAPETVIDRSMKIRFDANVAPGLPWEFKPEQREVEVKVGETKMVYYLAANQAGAPTYGNATYNVTPAQAGFYFVKMQCFCFNEQVLEGKEKVDMPVVFFIDPAIEQDEDLKSVKTITLSYTFFPAKAPSQPVARNAVGQGTGEAGKAM
ncbi:cytochrome c oxidase assembly protein [Aquabacter sp. L1I39]|uniref:cytochrome c oxidase assembly protein n=1 Tax=Aquabacter sp. L1I39 TaxID=2820278 RepID=UPI001ADD4EBE|nr:cytochrome c oxidase assembly protein [Aquabacter sp. L1I39]QTL01764.1 cytochrome c oxidase assembly protein [Aquabacter sp. L1I39]